jgi:hypothetical protein
MDSEELLLPLEGQKVVFIAPYGFVYVGILHCLMDGSFCLSEADNVRYWAKRAGGLPQLAREGYLEEDEIDPVGEVYLGGYVALYGCGKWHE